MQIYLGADHGGFRLKRVVVEYLKSQGLPVEDLGTDSADAVDYPEYGQKVAEAVVAHPGALGIVICGTGIGISIAANKVRGIRAALCTSSTHARLAKEHNNANVLALGERTTGEEIAKDIVRAFVETPFSEGERHVKRLQRLSAIEA
jgi:ribose 5-phosphate isomerase B